MRISGTEWFSQGSAVALAAALWTAGTGLANAIPVLDQSYVPSGNQVSGFGQGFEMAQTFTVGLSGALTQVDVQIFIPFRGASEDLYWGLHRTTTGVPNETSVLDGFIAAASVGSNTASFSSIDLSAAPFMVTAGDVLAISLGKGSTTDTFQWTSGPSYSSGAAYGRSSSPAFPGFETWSPTRFTLDVGFRTFVDSAFVAPIPEPSTWLLIAASLPGLVLWRRKRGRMSGA